MLIRKSIMWFDRQENKINHKEQKDYFLNNLFYNIKNFDPRKTGDRISMSQRYFRILMLFIMTFIPIIAQHLTLFIDTKIDSSSKTFLFEAIGYVQTLLFVIISYTIIYICQIVNRISKELNFAKRKEQPKKVVDTGISVLSTFIFFSIVIFVITSVIFVEMKARSNSEIIVNHIYNYTAILIPYLIFMMLSNYFISVSLVNGLNYFKIVIPCYISLILDIFLPYIFLNYTNIHDSLVAISLPSMIIVIVKGIIFFIVYLYKIGYFQNKEYKFCFDKNIYFGILRACLLVSIFAICYMISNFIQTILIINSNHDQFNYLWTDNGTSILLLLKINVYNFLYLIFCTSRAHSLVILSINTDQLSYEQKIIVEKKISNNNLKINLLNLLVGLIILCCIGMIVDNLFNHFDWINETINSNNIFDGLNYKKLIIKLTQSAFLIGIFAFFIVEITINRRYILFRLYKRNYQMFFTIAFIYLFSSSLITYLFVFFAYNTFFGLDGYLFSYFLYGVLSFFISYTFNAKRQYQLYKKNFPELIKDYSFMKFYFYKNRLDYKVIKTINQQQ